MSNPVSLEIPPNCQVLIQATANASLVQQVVATCDKDRAQFTGSGEGVPMTLPDASDNYQLSAEPHVRHSVSQLRKNHDHGKVQVDLTDKSSSSETPSAHPHHHRMGGSSQLELHAKVGTNCPTYGGMDEVYVTIDTGSAGSGPEDKKMTAECRATGWKPANVDVWDMRNHAWPLYNWVSGALTFAAPDGVPELKGASLVMTCWLNYWFSVPTGYKTTDWSAQLYNSKYKVTRVIP